MMTDREISFRKKLFTTVGGLVPLQFGTKRDPGSGVPWMSIWGRGDTGIDFFVVNEDPENQPVPGQIGIYRILNAVHNTRRDQVDIEVFLEEFVPTHLEVKFQRYEKGQSFAKYTTPVTKTEITFLPGYPEMQLRYPRIVVEKYREFMAKQEGKWRICPTKVVSPGPVRIAVIFDSGKL